MGVLFGRGISTIFFGAYINMYPPNSVVSPVPAPAPASTSAVATVDLSMGASLGSVANNTLCPSCRQLPTELSGLSDLDPKTKSSILIQEKMSEQTRILSILQTVQALHNKANELIERSVK